MIQVWLTYLSLASLALAMLCALFGSLLMVWFYLRYDRNISGGAEPPYPLIVAKGTRRMN